MSEIAFVELKTCSHIMLLILDNNLDQALLCKQEISSARHYLQKMHQCKYGMHKDLVIFFALEIIAIL